MSPPDAATGPDVDSGPPRASPWPEEATIADVACDRLGRICRALRWSAARRSALLDELRRLWEPWGGAPVARRTGYRSAISPQGVPFELAVVWRGGGTGVLVDFEALGEHPSALSSVDTGREYVRRLGDRQGTALDAYLSVEDLFTTAQPQGPFPLWHGVSWSATGPPVFHVYLNPAIHGGRRADEVTAEAASRLGVGRAWRAVLDHRDRLDAPRWRPVGVALRLSGPGTRRVRVYVTSLADGATLDAQAGIAEGHVPGRIAAALRITTGGRGAGWARPPTLWFTLAPGEPVPVASAVDIPLTTDNDAWAHGRVSRLMISQGLEPLGYSTVLGAVCDRPWVVTRTQTLVSCRPGAPGGRPARVAVYLAPGPCSRDGEPGTTATT